MLHLPTHLAPWLAYQSLHPAYHLEGKISQILDMKQTSANYACASVYSLHTHLYEGLMHSFSLLPSATLSDSFYTASLLAPHSLESGTTGARAARQYYTLCVGKPLNPIRAQHGVMLAWSFSERGILHIAPDILVVLGCNCSNFLSPFNQLSQANRQMTPTANMLTVGERDVTQPCNVMVTIFITCWFKCCL